MSDEDKPRTFEEALRAIADEVARHRRGSSRATSRTSRATYGVDADRAKRFMDNAGDWLRAQADAFGAYGPFPAGDPASESRPAEPANVVMGRRRCAARARTRWTRRPTSRAARWPRWTPAAGRSSPAPARSPPTVTAPARATRSGLVRELRVRDWIDADGEVTLVGRAALQRWLDTD